MYLAEILPLDYPGIERGPVPEAHRAAQVDERNRANRLRWHVETFGPEAGPIMAGQWPRPLTVAEIQNFKEVNRA